MPTPLPIDDYLDAIADAVRGAGAAVVVAPPGAGKTTRVPPCLARDGRVIVLQPRRIAARSLARRIAVERGWTAGEQVGWQVRFERRFTPRTQLLVATEGILTRRLQEDPLLSDFDCVVLDEFHERSLHADLALALVRQAREARPELGVVVMSATLEAAPVRAFLDDCPLIEVPGRTHPVTIEYAPHDSLAAAAARRVAEGSGHVLCFLPGAPEIRRAARDLGTLRDRVEIVPLHGSLSADEQDRALAESTRRKLILATNVAETSLTIDGVTDVVDSGLHKVLRYDPDLGLDRLEPERISRDSADQRAGRAGRTAPGHALRLWSDNDVLRPQREPEIQRVDLAAPLLDIFAWGEHPAAFAWFERPPRDAADRAIELLERIGAVAGDAITDLGRRLRRFPLHPRLAALLIAAGGTPEAAAACAILAEGWTRHDSIETCSSDLLALADRISDAPYGVRRAAETFLRLARDDRGATPEEPSFRRAVLAAWPDRVARRRPGERHRLLLANGHGALLDDSSGVRDAEYLVAIDLVAGRRGLGAEARVRLASAVERDWLSPTQTEVVHEFDPATDTVRATRRSSYGALPLDERPADVDPERAAELLAAAWLDRGLDDESVALVRRLRFAGVEPDLRRIAVRACAGHRKLPRIRLLDWLEFDVKRDLERRAPERLEVPSGRSVPLVYCEDGSVEASVKLQELFGLAATPTIGGVPVTLLLLAPNGRPVQTTRDLSSFWNNTYPEVRKELRGRYPKHPWPEDPWSAEPTARTKRRR